MPVTTYHQFINKCLVKPTDRRLILGTIHPHNVHDFSLPFFYGNKNFLWRHLENAFPCRTFNNVQNIMRTLEDENVWISDMISQCDRDHSGIYKDEELRNISLNSNQIMNGLSNSKIDTILFTSAFGCNNTAKLFVTEFNIKYRKTWNEMTREFIIPTHHFGREIRGIVMYSPTDGANQGIAKGKIYREWKSEKWNGKGLPMNAFKIAHYKEKMNFWNCNDA